MRYSLSAVHSSVDHKETKAVGHHIFILFAHPIAASRLHNRAGKWHVCISHLGMTFLN